MRLGHPDMIGEGGEVAQRQVPLKSDWDREDFLNHYIEEARISTFPLYVIHLFIGKNIKISGYCEPDYKHH